MESCIDAINHEYDEFVAAAADVLDATKATGSGGLPRSEALDKFKQRWQLLMASCDRAEEVVDSARRRIMPENVMDVASGVEPGGRRAAVTPPISVPRLERAINVTSSLAAELRHASGAAGGPASAHKAE